MTTCFRVVVRFGDVFQSTLALLDGLGNFVILLYSPPFLLALMEAFSIHCVHIEVLAAAQFEDSNGQFSPPSPFSAPFIHILVTLLQSSAV